MKAKNLNNSSIKTKKAIKDAFINLLFKYKQLDKIKVTDLVNRANINRSTFYLHYDSIYNVAEEFSNDIIDDFMQNGNYTDIYEYLDSITVYLKENEKIYKMLAHLDYSQLFSLKSRNKLYGEVEQSLKKHYKIEDDSYLFLTSTFLADAILNQFSKYFIYSDYPYSLNDIKEYLKEVVSIYSDYLSKL